jgi:hypothetical protein
MNEYNKKIIIPFLNSLASISECIAHDKPYDVNKLNNIKKIINMWTLINCDTDSDSDSINSEQLNNRYNNTLINGINDENNSDKFDEVIVKLLNKNIKDLSIIKKNRFYSVLNNNNVRDIDLINQDSDDDNSDDDNSDDDNSDNDKSNDNHFDDDNSDDDNSDDDNSNDDKSDDDKSNDNYSDDDKSNDNHSDEESDDIAYHNIKKLLNENSDDSSSELYNEDFAMERQLKSVGITEIDFYEP